MKMDCELNDQLVIKESRKVSLMMPVTSVAGKSASNSNSFEPRHQNPYIQGFPTNEDIDQHVRLLIMKMAFYVSMESIDSIETSCGQQQFGSECADVQADLRNGLSYLTIHLPHAL